jgi:hypothetical protein
VDLRDELLAADTYPQVLASTVYYQYTCFPFHRVAGGIVVSRGRLTGVHSVVDSGGVESRHHNTVINEIPIGPWHIVMRR